MILPHLHERIQKRDLLGWSDQDNTESNKFFVT